MTLLDVLVGLAACVVRVRRDDGALHLQTRVGCVAFVDPRACAKTVFGDGADRYCMSGWFVPVSVCRRIGDIDVAAWRSER